MKEHSIGTIIARKVHLAVEHASCRADGGRFRPSPSLLLLDSTRRDILYARLSYVSGSGLGCE